MISENLSSWLGSPVDDYAPGNPVKDGVTYRFRIDYEPEHSMAELFAAFTADPAAAKTTAIVIGAWFGDDSGNDSTEIVQLLVGARHALPNLTAIFFGDIISEENEMSWINQTDVSPLFSAYPALKHFSVRGGSGLSLGGKMQLASLESLTIETGGLPRTVLAEVFSMDLPKLEKLELWLGTDEYGWDGSIADLKPLLDGALFPGLKHLGLRDSIIVDQIAEALVSAPIMSRIQSLDLSLGTLTDEGAAHLTKCPDLMRLRSLDLHHHYCTAEGMSQLKAAFPGVNLSEKQDLGEYGPFVAVGE
ncbi:STM4015 family protein [Prosthecobacter sp.]|uniref:STM4015 family protein n=1 Tax=Prosthecobacter sp. TaxID=1965333 RepID=UPI003783799F